MPKVYESVSEAAAAVGANQATVTRWIQDGKLPAEPVVRARGGRQGWRILREDLAAAIKGTAFRFQDEPTQVTIFPKQSFTDPDSATKDAESLKVRWPAEQRVEPFSLNLFQGYKRFRAMTYSVSAPMIFRLLSNCNFEEFQILFGNANLVNAQMSGIMKAQVEIRADLSKGFIGIGGETDSRAMALIDQIATGRGELRALKDRGAHSKIYLLDSPDKTRVIVGSANLSELAFSGRQAEVMFGFENDEWVWSEGETDVRNLYQVGTVDAPLPIQEVHPSEVEEVDIGEYLFPTEMKQEKTVQIYIPSTTDDDSEDLKKLGAVLESADNRLRVAAAGQLRPTKEGMVNLTPAKYRGIIRRAAEAAPDRQRESTPNLAYIDRQFVYNGRSHQRPTHEEDIDQIGHDSDLLIQYLENYSQFEQGSENLQRDYFSIMSWLYFTPFMPRLKKAKEDQGPGDFGGKLVAILYGDTNCGKTNLVRLLLTSMFGSAKYYQDSDFTPSQVRARQQAAGLFPLFFDDVGPNRIGGTSADGVKIVKAQDQRWKAGEEYPCIIASLNSETYELIGEVRKRALTVYADSPLALDDIKKTEQLRKEAQRIHNRIGTSFYREYLYRMDQRLPTDNDELAELDYLEYSSRLIMELMAEHLRTDESLPEWCAIVTALDFDNSYWDGKRDAIHTTYLLPSLKVDSYPPPHGYWVYHQENYVLGVGAFQRRNLMKEFPPHVVDRRRSGGETLYLRGRRLDDFMRRDGRNWESPARRGSSWIRRLVGRG